MGDLGLWSRRSILTLLGAGTLSFAPKARAAELLSDDGSFIRTLDVSAEKLLRAYPKGQRFGAEHPDVVLIEFSDYNCGYCRRAWGPLSELVSADARLAVHLVHFAILSPGSEAAAVLQQAVWLREGADKAAALHRAMMNLSGHIDADRARMVCASLGIAFPSADLMKAARFDIAENRRLAAPLNIRYTPTFAIADTTFIGWPGPGTVSTMIAQARQCGRLQCG